MKERILILARWQRLVTEIGRVNGLLAGIPEKSAALDRETESFAQKLAEMDASVEALGKRYREMERESRKYLDGAKAKSARLLSIKTNKEYQAVLKEIEDAETANAALEDEMLALLDELDAAEEDRKRKKQAFGGVKVRIERDRDRLTTEEADLRRRLSVLEERRDGLEARIAAPDKTALDQARRRASGALVVSVRSCVCQGCRINIPAQMYNDLQKFEDLKCCPFCSRIIYWEPPELAAFDGDLED